MAETSFAYYLSHAVDAASAPEITPGQSGYFSTPSDRLDPRLFDGDQFRPSVRHWILDTLFTYWNTKFQFARSWTTVWAAGSGISYQWAASRGNGDLDILMGVNYVEFYETNPAYRGIPEDDLCDLFNAGLHADLWPKTASVHFRNPEGSPDTPFEVTYYVNPDSSDIRNINPYAAYDLTHDEWTIRPPVLPENPRSLYSPEFAQAVDREKTQARGLVEQYSTLRAGMDAMQPGSPGWLNQVTKINLIVSQASALFDSIHSGRRIAFSSSGSGYGDYYNYRWQAHKEAGTVQALNALSKVSSEAHLAQQSDLYGRSIESASKALTTASLWRR